VASYVARSPLEPVKFEIVDRAWSRFLQIARGVQTQDGELITIQR
jgi:hypothetical protein